MFALLFSQLFLDSFTSLSFVSDRFVEICLKSLDELEDFKLDTVFWHSWFKNEVDELLEFDVFRRNTSISALTRRNQWSGKTLMRLRSLMLSLWLWLLLVLLSGHDVLFNKCLTVCHAFNDIFFINICFCQERSRILLSLTFTILNSWQGTIFFRDGFVLDLKSTDCHFQQFIFPFGIQSLFMIKFLFFCLNLDFFSEHFGLFFQLFHDPLIFRCFLPQLINCHFKLTNSGLLYIICRILIWKCLNQST